MSAETLTAAAADTIIALDPKEESASSKIIVLIALLDLPGRKSFNAGALWTN